MGEQEQPTCFWCKKPVNHNRIFYGMVLKRKQKKFRMLSRDEKDLIREELAGEGIVQWENLDGTPHDCKKLIPQVDPQQRIIYVCPKCGENLCLVGDELKET